MIAEEETAVFQRWVSSEEAAQLRAQFYRMPALLKGLPGATGVPLDVEAAVLGIAPQLMERCRRELRAAAAAAVAESLRKSWIAPAVERVRQRHASTTVVCLGDSITADHQSWAEMLALALTPRVRVVNEGRSGDTTTDLISRFHSSLPAHRPDTVMVFAGTNDARTYRGGLTQPALCDEQIRANLAELAALVGNLGARLMWLTPAAVDDERVRTHPSTAISGARWTSAGCARVAAIVRERTEPVADLGVAFNDCDHRTDLLMPDGLHPNVAGQTLIFERAVAMLDAHGEDR